MKKPATCPKHKIPKVWKEGAQRWRCPDCRAEVARAAHLKNTFGITVKEYEAQLKRQKGRCAICRSKSPGRSPTKDGKKPVNNFMVDHDHETGQIRGLLCHKCNLMIGYAQERPKFLRNAARYLDAEGVMPLLNSASLETIDRWAEESFYIYLRPITSKYIDARQKHKVYWKISVELRDVPPGHWEAEGYNLDECVRELATKVPRNRTQWKEDRPAGWMAPESVLQKEIAAARERVKEAKKGKALDAKQGVLPGTTATPVKSGEISERPRKRPKKAKAHT